VKLGFNEKQGVLDHEKAGSVAYSFAKVDLQDLTWSFGVKNCTTTHTREEFERPPVLINIWFSIIKWLIQATRFRLQELNGGRVLRCSFEQRKFLPSRELPLGLITLTKVSGRYQMFMRS
jgi:hypothetical protein